MTDIGYQDAERGTYLMARADRLTAFRARSAPILGALLAVTDEGWVTTAAIAGEGYTDWQDGHDARAGAELLGIETTVEGALEDPAADKKLVNSLCLGLAVRFFRQGDYGGTAVLAANYAVTQWRDRRMAEDRLAAQASGVSPKAIVINKAKTAFQLVGEGMLASPLAKKRFYRSVGLGVFSTGTALGVAGQQIFRNRVRNHIRAARTQNAASCPDKVYPVTG